MMDALQKELEKLHKSGTYKSTISEVDRAIEQLIDARNAIRNDPTSASITLAKLQNPMKSNLDSVADNLKKVYQGLGKYGKALDKNLAQKSLDSTSLLIDIDKQENGHALTNRAIVLHFLRQGEFDLAAGFMNEAGHHIEELEDATFPQQFQRLYEYDRQIRRERNLNDAIEWARMHSGALIEHGSNLYFDLIQLQYIWIFQGPQVNGLPDDEYNGFLGAVKYARANFHQFIRDHPREIQRLSAAIAYHSNIAGSPYSKDFDWMHAFDNVAQTFRVEFCAMMGLSAESPLYVAVTAGAIAIPDLEKYTSIMKLRRAEWTTKSELPVEVNLPQKMRYHQIFVCPVSKEQATAANPPMRMPCGHVLAKQSLLAVSKGHKFKCPYCPGESLPSDAKEIKL